MPQNKDKDLITNDINNYGDIIVSEWSTETIKPIKPLTIAEYETSIDIPITREMLTAPLFARGKKNKVNQQQIFYLNPQKTRNIEISPKFNDTINAEFEERVFMALIDIGKRQQIFLALDYLPREIYTTVALIIKTMGLKYDGRYRSRVIEALERLQHTRYAFKNCFFNSEVNKFKEEEHTSILSRYNYESYFEVEQLNPAIVEFFGNDRRIKDFLIVEISKPFYTNLVSKKGYLNFDSGQLLSIDNGVARKLFMYCDRNRWQDDLDYKEKGDDLKIRVLVQVLAQIIPLNFKPKNIPDTIKILEQSLQYLKNNNSIVGFIFHKEKPQKNSWIEIFFKKSRKYDGERLLEEFVVHTQETKLIPTNLENTEEPYSNLNTLTNKAPETNFINNDDIDSQIMKYLDKQGLFLTHSTILELNTLLRQKDIFAVQTAISYTLEANPDNIDAYLTNCIQKGWYIGLYNKLKAEHSQQEKSKQRSKEIQEQTTFTLSQFESYINNSKNLKKLKSQVKSKLIIIKQEYEKQINKTAKEMKGMIEWKLKNLSDCLIAIEDETKGFLLMAYCIFNQIPFPKEMDKKLSSFRYFLEM